ncbi:ethylmalonyl-CoA decarboxylase isoform X3 [Paroedura picta]|uniref:ethylmalonyl-CoA decarboxylase isoform X3 n=1 Tax=Paroedura picta TaxID=143630 RepID=UPI0040574B2C
MRAELSEMPGFLWKSFHRLPKSMLLWQRMMSLYNHIHGFEEKEIKNKLQQFTGGSVNFSKTEDGIGILTLNNPQLMNAFTGTMMIELQEKVAELENWENGKGLIIHGAENTFCSGSDLNAVRLLSSPQDGMDMCMFMQNTLTRLMRLPLITVALVQGKALGGGAELTTACDFRHQVIAGERRCGEDPQAWFIRAANHYQDLYFSYALFFHVVQRLDCENSSFTCRTYQNRPYCAIFTPPFMPPTEQ